MLTSRLVRGLLLPFAVVLTGPLLVAAGLSPTVVDTSDIVIHPSGLEQVDPGPVAVFGGQVLIRDGADMLLARPGEQAQRIGGIDAGFGWYDLRADRARWAHCPVAVDCILTTVSLPDGQTTQESTTEHFVAWSPTGWLGRSGDSLIAHEPAGDTVLVADLDGSDLRTAVTDGTRTLIHLDTNSPDGPGPQLVLLPGPGQPQEVLFDEPFLYSGEGRQVTGIALTAGTEVWSTCPVFDPTGGRKVFRRTGGQVTQFEAPGDVVSATDTTFALQKGYNSWAASERRTWLWVGDGTGWHPVRPPVEPVTDEWVTPIGLLLGGPDLLLDPDTGVGFRGISGFAGEGAGVYAVAADGTLSGSISLSAEPGRFTALGLSGERLVYAQGRADGSADGGLLLARDTPVGSSSVGTQEPVEFFGSTEERDVPVRDPFSLSGDLMLRRDGTKAEVFRIFRVDLTVRAFQVATFEDAGDPALPMKQSGPYSLVGPTVWHLDGPDPLLDTGTTDTDLFGARVLWRDGNGRVRLRDLSTNRPARTIGSGAVGGVAVSATRAAWQRSGGGIVVRPLTRGKRRLVQAGSDARGIQIDQDVLSWVTGSGEVHILDLGDGGSAVRATGLFSPAQIDGGRLAGMDPDGSVHLRTVQEPWNPRLLAARTTGRAGRGGSWSASFQLTGPVTEAAVEIRRGRRVLTTITRNGEAGQDLSFWWDGTDADGRPLPRGRYSWVLTGIGPDGSALTAADGRSAVRGTVVVPRP